MNQAELQAEYRRHKQDVRKLFKAKRNALSAAERTKFSRLITASLVEQKEFQQAHTVHLYCSFGAEVSTQELVQTVFAIDKRVIMPIVPVVKPHEEGTERAYTLLHTEIHKGQAFGFDRFGMPAPLPLNRDDPGAMLEYCIPSKQMNALDCIIVPIVAFDTNCGRLGYGKGFYDRFLATFERPQPCKIGVAFSCQKADLLPLELHDEPLDMIVTEQGIIRNERASVLELYR